MKLIALGVLGIVLALMTFGFSALPAAAHVHVAENASHTQELANGQNHPGFETVNSDGLRLSCDGVLEPANAGPAGYGLETAHHGPDAGDPGSADGCFAVEGAGPPADGNPAIN